MYINSHTSSELGIQPKLYVCTLLLAAIHFHGSISRTDHATVASLLYLSQYDNFILLPGNNRNIYIYIYVYVCVQLCHLVLLFYLIHLYMFRPFLAHHQEILYCLVSRYGKRKCGRALWCTLFFFFLIG
jgi:hypothetical protein